MTAVINRGLKHTEFEHTCYDCKTTFVYNILHDLIPCYKSDDDAWVECPICGCKSLFSFDIEKLKVRRN